ncbi:ATP-binding protein [Saccharicrinis aurantiacus]|uniref:ATP-binding protein n=1 Tax=Saccharicrinis aurantiacus TaxID=1849719 RepID=UPI00248F69BE|nr:ATP-binding protein [Saccharicrinis aurantiacus]
MSYKIAISSGKGGTGKTTVSINLFYELQNHFKGKVTLVDCDVEEPNDLHFLLNAKETTSENISQLIPVINTDACTFCRKCTEYCEFNAIVVIPNAEFAEVNPNLCHSCGACSFACEYGAINEVEHNIGRASFFNIGDKANFSEGRLKVGSAMQTMLIGKLKKLVSDENEVFIFDSPPGTSCPVVETMNDADYVVLVTEPTPFGLHDLNLMVNLLNELSINYGVVVNKAGLGNRDIYQYLTSKNITLLGEIPFSKTYASNYSMGQLQQNKPSEIEFAYTKTVDALLKEIQ